MLQSEWCLCREGQQIKTRGNAQKLFFIFFKFVFRFSSSRHAIQWRWWRHEKQ